MKKRKKNPKILFLAKETLAVIAGSQLVEQIVPIDSSGMEGCTSISVTGNG